MKAVYKKKTKCPKCGSTDIHTMNLDQMCLDCDWNNSKWLVDQGQLDNIFLAHEEHFGKPLHEEPVEESEEYFAKEA